MSPSEGAAFDRLRDVFDQLPAAVVLVRGPEHVFEFANPSYRRLIGGRDVEGRTVDEAMPELREQGFVALLDQVFRSGERHVGRETPVTLVQGDEVEEIVVDFIYEPLRGVGGDVEAILGFAVDVTEAVRARELLRAQQEDRFRRAIDSMNDTVLIAERLPGGGDFVVTFANRGGDEVGGRRQDQLTGRRFRELWTNIEASGLLASYERVLETGEPFEVEGHEYVDVVAGREVRGIYDIRATALGDDLVVVFRDVTERLARERALAESRARLAREHETVVALQAALLPRALPALPGVDIAAEYVGATEDIEVGGDWFDSFLLGDGCLAVCVGDVAGKGIDAAQVMAQLRSAGRVAALAGEDPAGVMGSKNTLMVMGELGPFATTVFVRYDAATGELVWTSAGHLPPLLVPGDGGEPTFLPTAQQQPPLGVLPDVAYTCQQARLEPGDRLILYTDGLIERRGESLVEGLERLRTGVPAGADAATTCRTLLDVLGVASDRPDDVCVVTLRRTT